MSSQIDLSGRRAVVTGGASGIGLETCRRLLACGATLTMWDRDEPALRSAVAELPPDAKIQTRAVDVSDAAAVENAARAATDL